MNQIQANIKKKKKNEDSMKNRWSLEIFVEAQARKEAEQHEIINFHTNTESNTSANIYLIKITLCRNK